MLPLDEALLLAGQIVADPYSRTVAALSGWSMRLGVWLDLRTTVALSGSAEHLMPPDAPEAAQRHSLREIEAGAAVLAAHTAIKSN